MRGEGRGARGEGARQAAPWRAPRSRALTVLLLCAFGATPVPTPRSSQASAYDELTAAQKGVVDAGGQVFFTRAVPDAAWPRAFVYRVIDASPEQAAAVFVDYEDHASFIPDLTKSQVSRRIDPTTVDVDYTLAVPVLSDEDYTVRDHVSSYDGGASYRVEWTMVRASSTKAIEGGVRFEPHGGTRESPRTLMAYQNFVIPGSRLAGLGFIRSRALGQMQATAEAIARRVEMERTTRRSLLDRQVAALRDEGATGASGEISARIHVLCRGVDVRVTSGANEKIAGR